MNKNNFMKALIMIDEDLMEQAASPDTDAIFSEKDMNPYTGNNSETVVSGVDVYHRPVWRKVLTVAAVFAIVAGIAGSGAYYFNRQKSNKNTLNNAGDDVIYDSIYSNLKDNMNKYEMSTEARIFGDTVTHTENKEIESFFEYLDSLDMKTEIDENEFTKVPRSIAFCFGTDEEVCFTFELYENGHFTWTEKNNGTDKITYHSFSEGDTSFYAFSEMFELDYMESELIHVSEEEIGSFIDTNFSSDMMNKAYKSDGSISFELDIIDKEDIVDIKDSKEIVSTIKDYSLVGCWSNDTEFYRFLDNGYGYYYNGQYVSIINWEKSENDYHVYGGGITNIDSINHIIQYWSTDSISARTEDGLYLSSEKAGTLLYRPTESKYDDEFIVSLLNTPFSERIQGFWEISSTIKSSPNISDLGPSYFIFDGTNMISDIGSDSYSYYKHFEVPYTIKDDYLVIVKGEHNYEITSGNNTYSYIDDQFTIYYFLTFENEYLLADVFSGSHVLVKEDWPF